MLNKIRNFISNHKNLFIGIVCTFSVLLILFIGIVIYKKYYSPLNFLNSLNDEQQITFGRFIGEAYKNIYGYKIVCKTEDVILDKYPTIYKQTLNTEFEKINRILQKDGLDLEGAISLFLPYNEMQIINDFLYKELRSITDSADLGVKSACILFEEQADFIAKGLALSLKKKHSKIILSISE